MFRGSLLFLIFLSSLFGDKFIFKVTPNKTNLLIGEELKLTYTFKYKSKRKIAQLNFTPPFFENMHLKHRVDFNDSKEGDLTVIKKLFILTSSKKLSTLIEPASMDVAILKKDNKEIGEFEDYDYDFKTFQTKPLKVNFNSFSKDTSLLGDFNITSFVNKKLAFSNKATNLTIKINGKGNLEAIKEFNLNIKDATIYKNPPQIKAHTFTQKFAIISKNDFTIPSFSLVYYNKEKNKTITKKTLPIDIKVKQNSTQIISCKKRFNPYYIILALISGIMIGVVVTKLLNKKRVKNLDLPLLEKIKTAKDTKDIIPLLIPLSNHDEIKKLIKELEDDLYTKKEKKLSKKIIYSRLIKFYNNNESF